MAWTARNVIERLAEAGMLDPAAITAEDRKALGQLTEQDCEQIISIARKVYGRKAPMVRVAHLKEKLGRLCFPL
jgi:hypothetical protein